MSFDEVESFLQARRQPSNTIYTAMLTEVAGPQTAHREDIVFAQDAGSLLLALQSAAGAILASEALRPEVADFPEAAGDPRRILWVHNARLAFARIGDRLLPKLESRSIDPSAIVSSRAQIGDRVRIGSGVVIEQDVVIADGCHLEARVIVHAGTSLGRNVFVKAGAVLGSAGFGFVRDPETGEYVAFPQRGQLVIEDEVWIGANTTIDHGALRETRIGRGTKIDNLVHIAHNCIIGCNVVIAAQTGIAGSSVIGDGAVIAGQVGIADHVTIGPGVILGAKAGVPSHKNLQGVGQVFWGIPARPIQQYLRELARLRQSAERAR